METERELKDCISKIDLLDACIRNFASSSIGNIEHFVRERDLIHERYQELIYTYAEELEQKHLSE